MKRGCDRRLEKSFKNAPVVLLQHNSKVVLFSDCHRGAGTSNDNFLKNQHLYFAALQYYYGRKFIYIELGDGDELWENRSFSAIREIHGNVFELLSLFAKENRCFLLYGNHDHVMKYCREAPHYEGLVLKYCGCEFDEKASRLRACCRELYLTHGHQAELLNSTLWRLSRFLVRYLWKPLEQMGVLDPTSAAKNYQRRKRSEKRLSRWAQKNGCILITGHTHRPMLEEGGLYFNTGSCVHPWRVTCLEIEKGEICLVKWFVGAKPDGSLYVAREVLSGPFSLY